MKKFKVKRYFWQILIVAGLVATGLALAIGLNQSVLFDEAYSIRLAQSSWSELIVLTAIDTHPPLYYVALKIWAGIGGWGEGWLRLLSAIFYSGSVVVAGLLIRRLFDKKTALLALPFLLLAPLLIRYGFEIRGYAMASFIGVLATYILLLARDKKHLALWLIYAVLVTIGVLTLYYSALLWLAHLVWLIRQDAKKPSDLSRQPWMKAYAGSVVLFLPWMPNFVSQLTNGALAPISQAMTVDNLLGVISFNVLYKPIWQLDAFWSLVAIFAIGFTVWLVVRAYQQAKSHDREKLNLLLAYILIPVAIITLVSLIKPMYVERYLSHVAIGGIMLIAVAAAMVLRHRPTRRAQLGVGVFLLAMVAGVVQLSSVGNYNFQRLQYPEIKAVASQLKIEEPTQIVANDPYVMTEISYYLPTDSRAKFFSDTAELRGGYAPWSNSERRLDPQQKLTESKIQYVYYDSPSVDLEKQGYREVDRQQFGALQVVNFEK